MDNQELESYIDRFNKEKDIHFSTIDHLRIYNYLKELLMYRNCGTIMDIYDLKSNYKSIKFAHDLQCDIISRLEKSNEELSDRIVKSEGLISEGKII
jgi:hypothetical protein